MTLIKIIACALVGLFLLLLLRSRSPAFALALQISLFALLVVAMLPEAKELYERCTSLVSLSTVDTSLFSAMLKAFGILTLGGITADLCRDNSEGAIADLVEIAVKLLALCAAFPVIAGVVEAALSFLGN